MYQLEALPVSKENKFKASRERRMPHHIQSVSLASADQSTREKGGWPEDVPMELWFQDSEMLGIEKQMGPSSGNSAQAPLLSFQRVLSASLLIQSAEWVAQWDVCKYDKPLQYYSFSFGKPFRQEMITDPWYVNDGNAEISIWVNSCIFQPWNENLSVHIPIHTWKHHGAISWLLC